MLDQDIKKAKLDVLYDLRKTLTKLLMSEPDYCAIVKGALDAIDKHIKDNGGD